MFEHYAPSNTMPKIIPGAVHITKFLESAS